MMASRGMGDIAPSKMPKGVTKKRRDDTDFKQYAEGELDAVYIVYSGFINTMKQEPTIEQLLPLTPHHMVVEHSHSWDYLYEPDAPSLMEI